MAPIDAILHSPAFVRCLCLSNDVVRNVSSESNFPLSYTCAAPRRRGYGRQGLGCPKLAVCSSRFPKLPASTISVRDAATGAQILLVGCVHGSRVSADDVTKVLDRTYPHAVVLELCEPRLQLLRKVLSLTGAKDQRLSQGFESRKRQSLSQLSSSFGGVGPAFVALFLDAVYRLQVFAGVDPGIEFVEPIRRYDVTRIVCGDAPAHDTVKKLFNVFISPIKSVMGSLSSVRDVVGRVFLPPRGGINLATLFMTDMSRLAEMMRLLLPITFVSTLISVVGNAGAAVLDSAPGISGLAILNDRTSGLILPGIWAVVQMFIAGYMIVSTLRFMKVLISDRDRILTQSILETAAKMHSETDGEVTLCAVVGLLHVNGIFRLLEEHNRSI